MLGGMSSPVIAVNGASVSYNGRAALSDVDLTIDRGEIVAILGPNGSGKSTLIRAMIGLSPLATGDVTLFGAPVRTFREWHRVGYVPQRVGASSGVPATVREVVASGRLSRVRRMSRLKAGDRAAIDAALTTVGLTDRSRDSVATLSGGQQQRVLIARALASEPELLVLDEPTSGVDAHNQQALAEALGSLQDQQVTIVLVAHELGVMSPLIGRAVVMDGGRVACDGPPPTDNHVHVHDPEHAHPLHEPVQTLPWALR